MRTRSARMNARPNGALGPTIAFQRGEIAFLAKPPKKDPPPPKPVTIRHFSWEQPE